MKREPLLSLAVVSLLFTASGLARAQTAPAAPPVAPPLAPAAPPAAPPAPPAAGSQPPPPPAPAPTMAPPPPMAPLAPAPAQPPPPPMGPAPGPGPEPWHPHHEHEHGEWHGPRIELISLKLMLDKGLISQAEYDSAMHDLMESAGEHAGKEGTVVIGKWATTLYGFVEADTILDSTRGLNDLAGNAAIARPIGSAGGGIAGNNDQFTMGARNSRFGVRLKAPEVHGVRTSAMLEMDFLGNQPSQQAGAPTPSVSQGVNSTGVGEGSFWTSPTFRIRHMNLKIETPVVDVLMGQYWQLFGWQSAYQPNTVEIQGVPGEIYSRTPQIRISKTVKASPITFEAAIAASRPVQRDSGYPDGQAGLRLAVDSWTGVQTVGSAGTQISPLSVAVTGLLRNVSVNEFKAKQVNTNDLGLGAIAVDGFVPVIPGTKESK
ncbi:MAG TPA: hypothetical protein VKU41_16355, partial [Polyangiaceae bacterium]|nr:hypothetical protein [Polyangiaceae bacterium]